MALINPSAVSIAPVCAVGRFLSGWCPLSVAADAVLGFRGAASERLVDGS